MHLALDISLPFKPMKEIAVVLGKQWGIPLCGSSCACNWAFGQYSLIMFGKRPHQDRQNPLPALNIRSSDRRHQRQSRNRVSGPPIPVLTPCSHAACSHKQGPKIPWQYLTLTAHAEHRTTREPGHLLVRAGCVHESSISQE